MHRFVALAVILVASPAAAAPAFAIGFETNLATGGAFEAWDLGTRIESGLFFRIERWQANVSFSGNFNVESDKPERDSNSLFGMGAGGRLAYHVPIDTHGTLYFALGFERLWFDSGTQVRRTCRQTGACFAGYYPEAPDYDAWAPQFRVGIGPQLRRPDLVLGGTFEIIVEPIAFRDVPPDGVVDVALYAAFNMTVGFGPRRKRYD